MNKTAATKITALVFENSENLSNDFYVTINKLMKNYYLYGNNLDDIHIFLNENESTVNKSTIYKIKQLFPKKSYFSILMEILVLVFYIF